MQKKGPGFKDSEVTGFQITSSPVRTRYRTERPGLEKSYVFRETLVEITCVVASCFVCLFAWRRLFSSRSEQGRIAGFCGHGYENPGSISDV